MSSNVKPVSSDDQIVSSNASEAPVEAGGKKRSERLRARRDEAGLAQVSGWVPKDRRAFAREVLAALARGSNSLPPDPSQAAALEAAQSAGEAAQAEAAAARRMLAATQQHEQSLTAELGAIHLKLDAAHADLNAARAEIELALSAKRQAETRAIEELEIAKAKTAMAMVELEQYQKTSKLKAKIINWLVK